MLGAHHEHPRAIPLKIGVSHNDLQLATQQGGMGLTGLSVCKGCSAQTPPSLTQKPETLTLKGTLNESRWCITVRSSVHLIR